MAFFKFCLSTTSFSISPPSLIPAHSQQLLSTPTIMGSLSLPQCLSSPQHPTPVSYRISQSSLFSQAQALIYLYTNIQSQDLHVREQVCLVFLRMADSVITISPVPFAFLYFIISRFLTAEQNFIVHLHHSSVDGQKGWFHSLALVVNAEINTNVYVSLGGS